MNQFPFLRVRFPFPVISLLLLFSCRYNHKNENTASTNVESVSMVQPIKIDTSFRTSLDTVRIEYEYDTLIYSKEEFNEIADNFPELHENIPLQPDIEYFKSGIFKDMIDSEGNKQHLSFGSEAGQDEFYILYAYFLKRKNNYRGANETRNKLINAAHIVRNIFLSIHGFGTYFTHQYRRIYGYAEYWVYYYEKPDGNEKEPDIAGQKKSFLLSLKKEIKDIIEDDNDISGRKAKDEKIAELFPEVDKLDALITDLYILRCLQEYRYSYYQ